MLEPTKGVLQFKWSRFFKSICISMPFSFKFTVFILWEKLGNKPKLETAIARWKCFFQAYMLHSFGVISRATRSALCAYQARGPASQELCSLAVGSCCSRTTTRFSPGGSVVNAPDFRYDRLWPQITGKFFPLSKLNIEIDVSSRPYNE